MNFLRNPIQSIRHLLSSEEQLRRWKITREKGFLRYFLYHSFVVIPLYSLAGVLVVVPLLYGRLPYGVELLIGYAAGVSYALPWSILTWLRGERTYHLYASRNDKR